MRIVIATDDSPYSESAVREVAERPWPEGSVVRVISAVPRVAPSAAELWFDAGGSVETVLELRRERVQELADRSVALLHAAGLTAETRVLPGELQRIVVTEAKAWSADLIVVAFHGQAGTRQGPLGRVALAIIKHSPCSVEVFRAKLGQPTKAPLPLRRFELWRNAPDNSRCRHIQCRPESPPHRTAESRRSGNRYG